MSELLLGIDVGTGSSKGVLARPDGTIVATASRSHEMSLPRPGWAEMDAEGVWWGDVAALCRELLEAADGATVAGVCVSALGPCLVVCDQESRPLREGILYGIDMRATAEIDELTGEAAVVDTDIPAETRVDEGLKELTTLLGESTGHQEDAEALNADFDAAIARAEEAYDPQQTVMGLIATGGDLS